LAVFLVVFLVEVFLVLGFFVVLGFLAPAALGAVFLGALGFFVVVFLCLLTGVLACATGVAAAAISWGLLSSWFLSRFFSASLSSSSSGFSRSSSFSWFFSSWFSGSWGSSFSHSYIEIFIGISYLKTFFLLSIFNWIILNFFDLNLSEIYQKMSKMNILLYFSKFPIKFSYLSIFHAGFCIIKSTFTNLTHHPYPIFSLSFSFSRFVSTLNIKLKKLTEFSLLH
jgi:hypothetical protein